MTAPDLHKTTEGFRLPTFAVAQDDSVFWLNRDCPRYGFTPCAVGPWRKREDAQERCDWINDANRKTERGEPVEYDDE